MLISSPCSTCGAVGPNRSFSLPQCIGRRSVRAAAKKQQIEVAVIGGEDYILSQRSGVEEDLFKGSVLGVDADIASADKFRHSEFRSLSNLPEGLEPPQRFLDQVAMHFARNMLLDQGAITGRAPLILGIWGHKGTGKTFNLELCCRAMGVLPVIISAGELEDEWAGGPGRRLRERYRTAAQWMAQKGVPTCLVINDLDMGVGRYTHTQMTVNAQNLQGTLMALCDNPAGDENLQLTTGRPLPRVPIFVTANDLSRVYAPLVRDGRMAKFFWHPSREELGQVVGQLFEGLDAHALLDAFPRQGLDFFGAVKSRMADVAVRQWLAGSTKSADQLGAQLLGMSLSEEDEGGEEAREEDGYSEHPFMLHSSSSVGAASSSGRLGGSSGGSGSSTDQHHSGSRGGWSWRDREPVQLQLELSLEAAIQAGHELAQEQQEVMDRNLAREYMKAGWGALHDAAERRAAERRRREAPPPGAESVAPKPGVFSGEYWAMMARSNRVKVEDESQLEPAAMSVNAASSSSGVVPEADAKASPKPEPEGPPRTWPTLNPDELYLEMGRKAVAVLDIRCVREWDWGKIKGAVHMPVVLPTGTKLNPSTAPNPGFVQSVSAKYPRQDTRLCVYFGVTKGTGKGTAAPTLGSDDDLAEMAVPQLIAAGYTNVVELGGGFGAWDKLYSATGKKREKGKWADQSSGELEYWTASN